MWSKEDAENKIFDALEFIDAVIIEYFKTIYGMLVHPKKTLENLHENEVVLPLIFFFLNLLITGILDSFGNLYEFINKVLKSLVLTTKPSFDDAFLSMLGLLSGTLIFLFLFRLICLKVLKQKLPYASIAKPAFYASFLFIPISILKDVTASVFSGQLLRAFGGNSNFAIVIIAIFIANTLILWWWSYIFDLGLKVQLPNLNFFRGILFTLLIFVAMTAITSNVENIEKLSTLRYLKKYKLATDEALAKQPPDYFTAAVSTMFISQSKVLVPYRRYCENIRSIVYISTLIKGFDSGYAIKALSNNKYEEVESYFASTYEKVNAMPHTPEEYRHLKFLKDTLNNADKVKKEEKYIQGEYETSFGLQFGFSTTKESIRIIP
jgi:hypothetical protein